MLYSTEILIMISPMTSQNWIGFIRCLDIWILYHILHFFLCWFLPYENVANFSSFLKGVIMDEAFGVDHSFLYSFFLPIFFFCSFLSFFLFGFVLFWFVLLWTGNWTHDLKLSRKALSHSAVSLANHPFLPMLRFLVRNLLFTRITFAF